MRFPWDQSADSGGHKVAVEVKFQILEIFFFADNKAVMRLQVVDN